MTCEEMTQVLHAWLDREINPAESLDFEKHLQSCPACRKDSEFFKSQQKVVAEQTPYHLAPEPLVREVRSALRKAARAEAPVSTLMRSWLVELDWSRLAGSAAAAGLIILFIVFLVKRPSDEELWVQAVVSAEVRALMPNHLTDVASADQHTVKPWFNGKLDYTPPVVDLANKGFPLVGGRLDFLREHRMACVVYRRGNHFLNLFVWPTSESNKPEKSVTRQGYHIVHWVQGGMDCWTVSDVKLADVQEFAGPFRAALEPGEPPR